MTKHERRLADLVKVAEALSPFMKHKHAAAIYRGNRLISIGVNQFKTHPLQAKFGKNSDAVYLHAEVDAIKNALRVLTLDELRDCVLYVAHAKYGRAKFSKPCAGCQRAITHFGIRDCHWSLSE